MDSDRPDGGEGGFGHPDPGTLRCGGVGHEVQRAVPHVRAPQLDLLQRSDREQPGTPTTLQICSHHFILTGILPSCLFVSPKPFLEGDFSTV